MEFPRIATKATNRLNPALPATGLPESNKNAENRLQSARNGMSVARREAMAGQIQGNGGNFQNRQAANTKHMNTRYTPNTALPAGAKLLNPPVSLEIGSWVAMEYDAEVSRFGITWYRVKNGMNARGDREDWVADIPAIGISVHDYHWNGDSFGINYGSFDNACAGEIQRHVSWAASKVKEALKNLQAIMAAEEALKAALSAMLAQPPAGPTEAK